MMNKEFNEMLDILEQVVKKLKSVDKKKPKFKVGDKVIDKEGNISTICKIDNIHYYSEDFNELYTGPTWQFTDDEKAILRNLPEYWEYIARDGDGSLCLYTDKPRKHSEHWENVGKDVDILCYYDHIFKTIQFTDDEPCEFRKFI